MSNEYLSFRTKSRGTHALLTNLSIPPVALAAAVSLMTVTAVHAEDARSTAEIQAEVDRLKDVLVQRQQAASAKPATAGPAANSAANTDAPTLETADAALATDAGGGALDEIVVSSRNRVERLHDVPVSESVVSGKELTQLEAVDLAGITRRAANVNWNQGNQRTSSISIRGVGKIGQLEAQDPSVGVTVDGVPYAYNPLSSFDFYDIDSVEVLRGPQGTLLGKNANFGALNITTVRPSFTPEANWSVGFGQRDTVIGDLSAGGPIVDHILAWHASLHIDKGQGDVANAYNLDNTYQNKDRVAGRVEFLFTPNSDLSVLVIGDKYPRAGENTNGRTFYTPTPGLFSDGVKNPLTTDAGTRLARSWFIQKLNYSYFGNYLYGNGGNFEVNNDAQQPVVTGTGGLSTQVDWKLDGLTLTSITAARDYHFNAFYNDDGTPYDIQRSSGVLNNYSQISQELRLSSAAGGFFDYQTGIFLSKVHSDYSSRTIYGADAGAWYSSAPQYAALASDGDGKYLATDSLNGVRVTNYQFIQNKTAAAFGQVNWHLTSDFGLTTGLRLTNENRINPGSQLVADNGYAAELNPSSVNGVQLGGFNSIAFGKSGSGNLVANGNSTAQLQLADQVANKYFGVAISAANPGAAYNGLTTAQKNQVAAAKAVRLAQLGVLWNYKDAQHYNATLPSFVISPTYKINERVNAYLSWQHGEKAGIAQLVNGVSDLVRPEKTNAFELGLKSFALDNTLQVNADIFLMNIKDYQQSVRVLDSYTTALQNNGTNYYVTATGNVPKVQVKGVEIDAAYDGIKNTQIRLSGAFNDARYKSFPNDAQPAEYDTVARPGYVPQAYRDVSGKTLPGASKWTANLGIDNRQPIFKGGVVHTAINYAYASRFNSDTSLSAYAWIGGTGITDASVGVGPADEKFEFSVVAKNLFNTQAPTVLTLNSYSPSFQRWIGLFYSGKL